MNSNTSLTELPIFIVGPGRSGTTLVRSLLSAHSRISITPEMQFMQWVDERENVRKAPKNFEAFWKEYTSWVRFTDLNVDPGRCLELIAQQGCRDFQNIFKAVLTAYAEKIGTARVGEKSPSHVRYIGTLLEWFPNARIIIMLRDPRAVVSSQLGTPYVQERITETSLRRGYFVESRMREVIRYSDDWSMIFEEIAPNWEKDARVKVLSYEKLAHNPESEVRSICDFLGETYEELMLEGRKKESVQMPAGITPNQQLEKWRRKHHEKSMRPISTKSLNKWKKNLSAIEVSIIEYRCKKGMQKYGYPPSLSTGRRFKGGIYSHAFLAAEKSEFFARNIFKSIRSRLT